MDSQPIDLVDHSEEDPGASAASTSASATPAAPETQVETLVENQRGWFIFGLPFFSAQALWNLRIDPAAWVDGQGRRSGVDVTNAQVPDPSWEWSWKRWYVDMSGDVDEEGWQYSFMFQRTAWHGNHPWFHSFVRRRRWLRRRSKRSDWAVTEESRQQQQQQHRHHHHHHHQRGSVLGHVLSSSSSSAAAAAATAGVNWPNVQMSAEAMENKGKEEEEEKEEEDEEQVRDVDALLKKLRTASIDREKISLVLRFVDEGGQQVRDVAKHMPTLMSMLVFQHSRRHLLTTLTHRLDEARAGQDKSEDENQDQNQGLDQSQSQNQNQNQNQDHDHDHDHDHDQNQDQNQDQREWIHNLLRAVEAADGECRKLEYWSDVKDLLEEGKARLEYQASRESR